MNWYPLTFQPIYKDKIWGGYKLNKLKNIQPPITKLGESWEISDVGEDVSIVNDGIFKGKSLKWLLENYGEKVMGKRVYSRFGNQFPILIKYINAADDLSIQLHPDDTVAQEKHHSFGKTEMWYVIDASDEARLTLGFKEVSNESAFAKAIQNNTVPALLNAKSIVEGESFLIKPGFIHAIGAGITLAEIQQSSDLTYRVYDYNRKDDKGESRELHIKESIAAADYSKAGNYQLTYDQKKYGRQELTKTTYFETDILQFQGKCDIELFPNESLTILMNVGDDCHLLQDGTFYSFLNSQTYLIPAALNKVAVHCAGSGKLLVVHL
jgi:mannose-6-phosphate isomerase